MSCRIEDKDKLCYIDEYIAYFDFDTEYESDKGKVKTWIEKERKGLDGKRYPANIKIINISDKNFNFQLRRNIYEINEGEGIEKVDDAEVLFISSKGPQEDRIFMKLRKDWDKLTVFLEKIKIKYSIIKEEDKEYKRKKEEEKERLRKLREEEERKEIDRLIASII